MPQHPTPDKSKTGPTLIILLVIIAIIMLAYTHLTSNDKPDDHTTLEELVHPRSQDKALGL